jgi:retinol dehydrogenase-12
MGTDLASYQSVLAFGARVRTQLPRIDAFIANTGMELQEFKIAEGLVMHLTVHVVSTFLSAINILPKLQQTSMYHIFGPDEEFDAGLPEDVDMFEVPSDPKRTDII